MVYAALHMPSLGLPDPKRHEPRGFMGCAS
jgi:hypothetical protein